MDVVSRDPIGWRHGSMAHEDQEYSLHFCKLAVVVFFFLFFRFAGANKTSIKQAMHILYFYLVTITPTNSRKDEDLLLLVTEMRQYVVDLLFSKPRVLEYCRLFKQAVLEKHRTRSRCACVAETRRQGRSSLRQSSLPHAPERKQKTIEEIIAQTDLVE